MNLFQNNVSVQDPQDQPGGFQHHMSDTSRLASCGAAVNHDAKVRPTGVGIMWDPPRLPRPLFTPQLSCYPLCPCMLKRSRGTGQLGHYSWLTEQPSQLVANRREEWADGERLFPQESNPAHGDHVQSVTRGRSCGTSGMQ